MKSPNKLTVRLESGVTTALVYPAGSGKTLILGHGAGAGQQSGFMVAFARALSALGVDVVTFNFLYAEQGRRIPDRAPALEACFRAVIEATRRDVTGAAENLFVGGKSMGGRIATQLAASDRGLPVKGLVLLGYPLHPPGRPDERRDKHLPLIGRPMLFVQGSRDAFGTPAELQPLLTTLSPPAAIQVVEGGDHSFKLARRDTAAQVAAYAAVQEAIASWLEAMSKSRGTEGATAPE